MSAGFINAAGKEIRLGKVQRAQLEMIVSEGPQRRAVRNPTMVALDGHGFVTTEPHFSQRLNRNTTDRVHNITAEGRRYLEIGRDRN